MLKCAVRVSNQRVCTTGTSPDWAKAGPTPHPQSAAKTKSGQRNINRYTSRKIAIQENNGADGGGRTHTLSRVPDFESGASANSATSAPGCQIYFNRTRSK